ncbi:hypothetical protein [Curtobacterium sp. NPDC092190]|uniref:hypothetical protein n=1 Tax=Curtobacterium sp. NPDC092190 TaxID=3363973 RepID=UPI00381F1B39
MIDDSRAAVHHLVRAAAVVPVLLSLGVLVSGHGDARAFTVPVAVHAVLVVLALEVSRLLALGVRFDGLTLFSAWEAARGCVAPVIIQYVGNGSAFHYRLGNVEDSRTVLILGSTFFASAIVVRLVVGLVGGRTRGDVGRQVARLRPSRIPTWVLIVAGSVGMVIRFPTPGAVLGFLSGAIEQLQGNDQIGSSGIVLIGMVLRPLLFVGLVLELRRRRSEGRRWSWLLLPLGLVLVFGLASYGLNRATVAYAVFAAVFVFLDRSERRLQIVPMITAVAALGTFFVGIGTLRATLWVSRTALDAPTIGIVPALQSVIPYFGTPMQLAAALPWIEASNPFGLRTFGLSLLSPVPGAPDVARTESSTAVYNHVVYHSFLGKDQLLPTWFEGYLCFGLVGVVLAGASAALMLSLSDTLRLRASTVLSAYGSALLVLWSAQAGVTSFGVIEQNVIYFVLVPMALGLVGTPPEVRASPNHERPQREDPHALRHLRPDRGVPRHAHGRDPRQPVGRRPGGGRRRRDDRTTALPR